MNEDLDDTVIGPTGPLPGGVAAGADSGTPDSAHTVIVPRPAKRRIDHATGEPIDEPDAIDLESEQPATVSFYALRLGWRDEVVVLDAPCLIGRRPSLPRIPSAVVPHLVKVPSPRKEVSSSHLEVRQLGSSVIVTDLKSTNGSVVLVPGSVPRKLRQGESVVVSPGTLVDIGDNNILQILPMQRPA
ncbi:MAG: FHA domain-containing protein [Rhodoglobus sp.]